MAGLAREYANRYGQDDELSTIAPTQPEVIVLLRRGEETVAGGALLAFAPGVGELKRMWTAPSERRRGHARRVLAALEDAARARGYRAVRPETGRPQPEAVARRHRLRRDRGRCRRRHPARPPRTGAVRVRRVDAPVGDSSEHSSASSARRSPRAHG